MAVEIGALRALLSLDSAAFEKGAKRAQASMGNLQRSLAQTADRMKSIGRTMSTRMTAPIVGATGLLVRSSLKTIDAQGKMAESLGTTTASLQVLARAADTAGISQNELEQSLVRMTRRVSLAAQGAGPAADALDRLGLSFADLQTLDAAERVGLIQQRISDLIPAAEQAGVASQVFGDRTGVAMLRLQPETIAAANDELDRFGVTVSEIDTDRIEAANDAMTAVGLAAQGLGNQIAVALAPSLTRMAETIQRVAEWFDGLSPNMKRVVAATGALAAAAGPAALAIGLLAAGLAAVATPVTLVVAGIAGLTAAAVAFWPEIKAATQAVIAFGRDGIEQVKTTIQELPDMLAQIPGQMLEIGNAIIDGLKDGILNKWDEVKSSVMGVGAGITEGFKGLFRTQSPSRVFMDIGRNLMEGLGIGIADNAKLAADAAASAAKAVTDASKDAMSVLTDMRQGAKTVFHDVLTGAKGLRESLGSVLGGLASRFLSQGTNLLFDAIFPSFAGGGYTGAGARTGGIDGRGGFPAILHPNETVVDHSRGGMAGALNVTVTMDRSTGSLGAFVRDEAGRVLAQAEPRLVSQSVAATYQQARERPLP